jgi:hypothetical protein
MSGFYELVDNRNHGAYYMKEGRGQVAQSPWPFNDVYPFPWPAGFVYVLDTVNWTAARLPKTHEDYHCDWHAISHRLVFLPPPTQPRRNSR